jgi:hypothetical protein
MDCPHGALQPTYGAQVCPRPLCWLSAEPTSSKHLLHMQATQAMQLGLQTLLLLTLTAVAPAPGPACTR